MDEKTAEQLAAIVGGEAWNSGGGIWLVTVNRDDGSLVVFSGDAIAEYENEDAFDATQARKTILLTIPETDGLWVVTDAKGGVIYRDADMKRGWPDEEDARHEAMGIESRTGERMFTVRQSEADS